MPVLAEKLELYSGDRPIFDMFGVEDEIGRALDKQVPLKSGGYLVIDQTEAMTTIDVNTGSFLGQRNLTGLHGDVTLPGTRQEQHVVDDGTQPFQFFQVGLHHLLQLSVVARPRQRHLRLAHQVGQRRAQFVGDVGVEAVQAGVGRGQPVQRAVERAGQVAQVCRQAVGRQALRQPLWTERARLPSPATSSTPSTPATHSATTKRCNACVYGAESMPIHTSTAGRTPLPGTCS
ncbi:hypothetical protein G6F32_013922 [Rhizopus arrhizus]|nr:hypothetical protein G6F32_013922 [Rhizopus arrhizus]